MFPRPLAPFGPGFFLQPRERALATTGIVSSWGFERLAAVLITALILWGGGAILLAVNGLEGGAWYTLLGVLFALHLASGVLYVWRRIVTTEYVLTEEFVYARRGQFLLHLDAAALDRVTDLHIHQGVIGRLFGFSTLRVLTAGGGLHMPGLRDAVAVRGRIQEARQELIARLLREAGRGGSEGASPSRATECPRCAHVFSAAGPLPLDVTCPKCGAQGTLFAEAPA